MRKTVNRTRIEGYLYEHNLELRKTGEASKNPGTEYIRGDLSIATDNKMTNIVKVYYTYVTEKTSTGKTNSAFGVLNKIINDEYKTVMGAGKDVATKLRIDSAIGLNEFYTDRNGTEELVSAKRNEGGFITVVSGDLTADEGARNTFEVDMVITNVRRVEGDEEKGTKEKMFLKGTIFDFKQALLPIEFSVVNPIAMDYFEGLDISAKNPVFTKLQGKQISETIVTKTVEEGAFGEDVVKEVQRSNKDFVVTWALKDPYDWDEEGSILASELTTKMQERETYIATIKQRNDEYKASRVATPTAPKVGGFNF